MKSEDYREIENLIERYFNAETTLEEESLIRKYYRNTPLEEMEPHLRGYAELFGYFSNEIDSVEKKEMSEKSTEFIAGELRNPKRITVRGTFYKPLMRWGTVAAAAVLIVSFFLVNPEEKSSIRLMVNGERVNNSELAMSFADSRLDKVSEMMGQVKKGNEVMERFTSVGRAMAPLEKIGTTLTQTEE